MIELTGQDGARLFLNPDAVWHLRPSGSDQTAIYATSGAALFVQGSVDDIARRLSAWSRSDDLRPSPPPLHVVRPDDEAE